MELIYYQNKIIGSVDKMEESKNSGYFASVLMPNEQEDKEAFFTLKKDAVSFVKSEYKKSIKNQSKMSTKKPTPKQLAARKRFAEMSKSGELAKKREAAAKKKKSGLKKPAPGATKFCATTVGVTGRRKKDGTQKKGYVATKGGTLKKKSNSKK